MKKKISRSVGTLLTLGLLGQALPSWAEDMTVNRLLASQCAQCHGTNGYAIGDFDEIAGEDARDMTDDLLDMKREDRPENIMDHQALGYTDEQIRRIASYYATLQEEPEGGDKAEEERERAGEESEDREIARSSSIESEEDERDDDEHDEDDEDDEDDD